MMRNQHDSASCPSRGPGRRRSPMWPAPVDALPQHCKLRRGQSRGSVGRRRPRETAPLKNFVVQAESLAIKVEKLDAIAAPAAEGKDGAAGRLLTQDVLNDGGQTADALAQIGNAAGEIDPHTCSR